MSHRLADGADLTTAFRDTVASFEGSVAIGASAAPYPDHLLLALRGSGQALYVGLADDCYVVASEPYGLVELTSRYLRLDGDTPANPENPNASRGQIVVLDGSRAGTLEGIARQAYDGTVLPVTDGDLQEAQVTTRDIDRGTYPHFLLKEITEAPTSFRKTLRGKLIERDGALHVALGDDVLASGVRERLRNGRIDRIQVIGQGTAHVAGQSLAGALLACIPDGRLRVEALPATELSGFGLRSDMSDTLVVAISQSGTTTDTNRTVDLVRDRGATVLAIVNRRGSDLTDKSDGVLYTSDGRDVEMSVASTKAFYAQIAAGFLLAWSIAEEVGGTVDPALVAALRDLPAPWRPRSAGEPTSRPPPSSSRRPSATGRSSATAPTASRPRSCASSSASSATGRSPATPPRTRSTSTCPASRSSSCAPPASRGPPPTTWPRRWRSTAPTRRRRSSSPPTARRASPPRCT